MRFSLLILRQCRRKTWLTVQPCLSLIKKLADLIFTRKQSSTVLMESTLWLLMERSLLYTRSRVSKIFVCMTKSDFGTGSKFVWSNDNGFAIHRGDEVRLFDSNFNQTSTIKTSYQVESLHGGNLL